MKPHPITGLSLWQSRSKVLAVAGTQFELRYDEPRGEDVFGVIYPDPVETIQESRHAAAVNGRAHPYPADAVVYARALQRTLTTPQGCEPPDLTQLLKIFDTNTELFYGLAEAALEVMGIGDGEPDVGGIETWEQVHAALLCGETSRALALAEGAIRALRGDGPPELESELPIGVAGLGNDCGEIG